MKLNLNKVLMPVTALAVSWSFIACDKPAEKPANPAPEQPSKPAEPAKPADSAKPAAEASKPAAATPTPAAPAAPAADIAKLREIYGFAARLPKDVEMFSGNYRMLDVWSSVANSKWAATVIDLLGKQPEGQRMTEQWNSPQAKQGRDIISAFLGNEFFFAGASGFSAKAAPLIELQQKVMELQLEAIVTGGMLGGNPADTNKAMMRVFKDNATDLIPKLTKLEMPPLLMGFKAGRIRADFDGFIKKGLESGNLPPGVEQGTFKVGNYDFQSLSVTVRKVVPQFQEANMQLEFKELLGDEAAAKAAVDALMAKRFEFSWGWVDDYLVMGLGTDHAHVKLAAGDADSVLANPEVAARASAFAGKNPISLAYTAKAMFDAMSKPMELAKPFAQVTASLQGILPPDAVKGMTDDVKKMEGKVQDLFKTVNSSAIGVTYIDGGIHMDMLGGPRSANAAASQPLAFSSLITPTTALSVVGRSNGTNSAKTADLIEEGTAMLWGWYEKYGRTMVPEDGKQNAAMVEAMAIPMVKEFWKSCRVLGKALGDNSAMLVDLNGSMPPLPNAPKVVLDGGKMPRIAIVMDLKDRAALGEAWKGFEKLIKQGIALIPAGADAPPAPEPKVKTEGDLEIHYVELPVQLGDMLPHIAISKDKWIMSTSPNYSAELAKQAASGSLKADAEMQMNLGGIATFAEHWVKLAASNPTEFFQNPGAAEYFQKNKETIDTAIRLIRSIKSMGIQMGEEGGKAHTRMSLSVEDSK
ncbi:MAG: hypothetical protein RL088_361 [Verrucomicrobiota bacterium]|jgi:hypothetical protein